MIKKVDVIPSVKIKRLLKTANLSKSEKELLRLELEKEEQDNLGTHYINTWGEYSKLAAELYGKLLSPSLAAAAVGISRARINQLETEKKICVYRIKADVAVLGKEVVTEAFSMLPYWIQPFVSLKHPKGDSYVFVDMVSLVTYLNKNGKRPIKLWEKK